LFFTVPTEQKFFLLKMSIKFKPIDGDSWWVIIAYVNSRNDVQADFIHSQCSEFGEVKTTSTKILGLDRENNQICSYRYFTNDECFKYVLLPNWRTFPGIIKYTRYICCGVDENGHRRWEQG
jgi:hypothetical protein